MARKFSLGVHIYARGGQRLIFVRPEYLNLVCICFYYTMLYRCRCLIEIRN